MRELNNSEIEGVSGGSLTSSILGFFKSLNSNNNNNEEDVNWVRPDSISPGQPISGSTFGKGVVGIIGALSIVGMAAATAFGMLNI